MKEDYIQRLKDEIQNAFKDLENEGLGALYGTLLEISVNIIPNLWGNTMNKILIILGILIISTYNLTDYIDHIIVVHKFRNAYYSLPF